MSEKPFYWTDPYIASFKVFIEEVRKRDNQYQIQIREEVIRAAGGGQAGDRGVLSAGDNHVTINDTVFESGKVILIADGSLPEKSEGNLEIDIEWRTAMMKNHTSEHIFVSTLKEKFSDIEIGDLWIDGEHGTIEILNISLSFEDVFEAEKEVQRIIDLNLPVESHLVDATSVDSSTRAREGLTEKHDRLRIVSVGELDSSACSGIHVESTGQIGFFKVIDIKQLNETTKIEFISGNNALTLTRELFNSVLQRKYTYPFEIEQLGAVLDRARIAIGDRTQMIEKIGQFIAKGPNVEMIGEVEFRHEYLPGFESKTLKNLANQISFQHATVLLLFAPGKKAQVILRTYHTPLDAKEYISEVVQNVGGKGGGSSDNYTGGFIDIEDPLNLYNTLVLYVREVLS